MSEHNIWNDSWGSIRNLKSNPPEGWNWDYTHTMWVYSSPISTPGFTPSTIYITSSIDCFPDVSIHTPGTGSPVDPVEPPVTSSPPAPPVSYPQSVPEHGKVFGVCFDDHLLNQKGWTRPRYEGCKLRSLYYNEYTDEMDDGKEVSPIQNPNLETSIDGLQFIITASHDITLANRHQVGNPFELHTDSGIVKTLTKVSQLSCNWRTEFIDTIPQRERYPPKTCTFGSEIGTDQTMPLWKGGKTLPLPPFGPKIYDIPLVPSSFYKINDYTQEPEKVERKKSTFDLVPSPIKLNPIDPAGLSGGPFFLGSDPGQNEQVAGNNRLPSEYQIRDVEREYVWEGPWSYVDSDPNSPSYGTTVTGTAVTGSDITWGWNDTIISRSAIIPEERSVGDLTYGKTPVIENYSNAVFFGNTVYGYQQSDIFPGPGPDFAYIKLEKAYVFNSEDDSFFVQEIKSEGEDRTFQNLMQSTFPWATDFRIKLLDYEQENNLKSSYGTHWNRGYFSEIATYSTASSHRTASGHYPGTGLAFQVGGGEYIEGTGNNTGVTGSGYTTPAGISFSTWFGGNTQFSTLGIPILEGSQYRKAHDQEMEGGTGSFKGGGYYYMASTDGGGEGALLYGGFKAAGIDMGVGELDFPKYQTEVYPGNWKTGPGVGSFFGLDPVPGAMRYYNFKFVPVHRPVDGMSANGTNNNWAGRVLSGTFEINDKNPAADWWFSKGGEKEIKWVSESLAADVTSSMKIFMDECHRQKELYIVTFNEAKHCDKSFNQGFARENHPYKKRTITSVPGYPGDPDFVTDMGAPVPYGDAFMGEEDNISAYSYYLNYARPINTFGSMMYSNAPETVGVKNGHNLLAGLGDAVEIGMGWYDYSAPALAWSAVSGSHVSGALNPATGDPWSVNDEGYKGKYTGYGPVGGISAGGINAPRFLNGSPYIQTGDATGYDDVDDGKGSNTSGNYNIGCTHIHDSISVWTGYMYGNNYTSFYTGNKYINFKDRKGWPGLNTWTISRHEEKPNFILTDLNVQEELPQGVGGGGFILIPDTLNPRIKANLDYYLSRAGLIGKEKAPKYKDKSIKKGAFLSPRIKLKKRKRKGWIWKLKRRIKGRDY